MTTPLIIDCDPGQDDAINLFLAFCVRKHFDIHAITTVAGNVTLDKTTRNSAILCELAGQTDIPIYAGCAAPLKYPLATAEEVHGQEGLDGIDIHTPKIPVQTGHAVDFIIQTLRAAAPNSFKLVATGPLTNLATAFDQAPDILPNIREIVIMGGAMREAGNITPSAEFNIYVDPHAAQKVLECTRPITLFGLDVTHQLLSSQALLSRLKPLNSSIAKAAFNILRDYSRFDSNKYGTDGGPMHDPCTMGYLIMPELFNFKNCHVEIETDSALTRGHTSVDFWHVTGKPANVHWAYKVNTQRFFDMMVKLFEAYS